MIPAIVVFLYLAIVLGVGIFGGRSGHQDSAEGYFLAGRAIGPAVFLLSLFGTNMTAFSILGASGHAFANGIVTYGLMASSAALIARIAAGTTVFGLLPVVPMTIVSALLMVVVSMATRGALPGPATLARYEV